MEICSPSKIDIRACFKLPGAVPRTEKLENSPVTKTNLDLHDDDSAE